MEADTSYFRRRATEERAAALNSTNPRAREAHVAMAERYEDLVGAMLARESDLGLGSLSTAH